MTDNSNDNQLPATFKALVSTDTGKCIVKDIPLLLDGANKNAALPSDCVLVRTRAIGVNPTDERHASTEWGEPGMIVGCDGAGDVVLVGAEVKHVGLGDRVVGFTRGTMQRNNGAFAEYCRYKACCVLKLPEGMTYEEGASLSIPHWTAAMALYKTFGLPPPSKAGVPGPLLVWSGASSVGRELIQLARVSDMEVITTASPQHAEFLTELGAAAVLDYKSEDVVEQIKKHAGAKEIKFAVDCVVLEDSTRKCVESVAHGDHVVTLLPIPDDAKEAAKAKGVTLSMVLSYTLLGEEFTFAKSTHYPPQPEDAAFAANWAQHEWPLLVKDWSHGKSDKLRSPPLKHFDGGLEGVEAAFEYMREGKVRNEKLVLRIA